MVQLQVRKLTLTSVVYASEHTLKMPLKVLAWNRSNVRVEDGSMKTIFRMILLQMSMEDLLWPFCCV